MNFDNMKIVYDVNYGLQIDTCDCERCGNRFTKDELTIYENKILCFNCEEKLLNNIK